MEPKPERILSSGKLPEAIHMRNSYLYFVEEMFHRHGLELFRDVPVIADWSYVKDRSEFHGISHRYPYEGLSAAAGFIRQMLNGAPPASLEPAMLNLQLERR